VSPAVYNSLILTYKRDLLNIYSAAFEITIIFKRAGENIKRKVVSYIGFPENESEMQR
jgi:hypothetical protein